uniref:Uncharacterized protein n=1 Tax=Burkholderia multivorans TaxID=87883 RepID=Q845T8_9BURK|nr:hypothetical protein [Burkholderia multivorans ATCC 17616]
MPPGRLPVESAFPLAFPSPFRSLPCSALAARSAIGKTANLARCGRSHFGAATVVALVVIIVVAAATGADAGVVGVRARSWPISSAIDFSHDLIPSTDLSKFFSRSLKLPYVYATSLSTCTLFALMS